jgi:hypothetical protein
VKLWERILLWLLYGIVTEDTGGADLPEFVPPTRWYTTDNLGEEDR